MCLLTLITGLCNYNRPTSCGCLEEFRLRVPLSAMFVHWIFLGDADGCGPFHTSSCQQGACSCLETPHEWWHLHHQSPYENLFWMNMRTSLKRYLQNYCQTLLCLHLRETIDWFFFIDWLIDRLSDWFIKLLF